MLVPILISIFGGVAPPLEPPTSVGALDAYARIDAQLSGVVGVRAQLVGNVAAGSQLTGRTSAGPRLIGKVRIFPE
jgi:hypothetical protein